MSFRNSNFVPVEEADEGSDKGDSPEEGHPLLSADTAIPHLNKGVRRRVSANGGNADETESLLTGQGNNDHMPKGTDSSTVLINKASVLAVDSEPKNPTIEELDESVELQEMCSSPSAAAVSLQASDTPASNKSDVSSKGSRRKVSMGTSSSSPPSTSSRGSAMSSPRGIMKRQNNTERQARIQILQRELARIQRELKSLGELEVEVSYVWHKVIIANTMFTKAATKASVADPNLMRGISRIMIMKDGQGGHLFMTRFTAAQWLPCICAIWIRYCKCNNWNSSYLVQFALHLDKQLSSISFGKQTRCSHICTLLFYMWSLRRQWRMQLFNSISERNKKEVRNLYLKKQQKQKKILDCFLNLCHHAIISVKHWGMYATMDFSSLPSSQNGFIRDIGVIEAISVLTMWSSFSIERKRMWRNGEQNGIQNVFIILHEFASVLCSSRFMLSSKQIKIRFASDWVHYMQYVIT